MGDAMEISISLVYRSAVAEYATSRSCPSTQWVPGILYGKRIVKETHSLHREDIVSCSMMPSFSESKPIAPQWLSW